MHITGIVLCWIQHKYGSWFFMPQRYRKRAYDSFRKSITNIQQQHILYCDICLNLLSQPELEYSDLSKNYKWKKFNIGVYFQMNCKHKFHPNCILKNVIESDPK